MLCVVCKGSGSILTTANKLQWWECPGGGAGTHWTSITPPTIKAHSFKKKFGRKKK